MRDEGVGSWFGLEKYGLGFIIYFSFLFNLHFINKQTNQQKKTTNTETDKNNNNV